MKYFVILVLITRGRAALTVGGKWKSLVPARNVRTRGAPLFPIGLLTCPPPVIYLEARLFFFYNDETGIDDTPPQPRRISIRPAA